MHRFETTVVFVKLYAALFFREIHTTPSRNSTLKPATKINETFFSAQLFRAGMASRNLPAACCFCFVVGLNFIPTFTSYVVVVTCEI